MQKYNLCLIGDSQVGKSSFLEFLQNNSFINNKPQRTIGVEHMYYIRNNKKWNIWDLAGDKQFENITIGYYKNVDLFLLFFDVNNIDSFNNLEYWVKNILSFCTKNKKIILVGNKCDLKINYCIKDLNTFCNKYSIIYNEISLKNNHNIELLLKVVDIELENDFIYLRSLKSSDKYILFEEKNKKGCCYFFKKLIN